ncbi:tRNA pseudouridine synthase D [Piscirickettsia salmonis]|uniref:tRNA pseudouridine synthase D n=1 Tax=Piscirickettsia salmonis TaxID=1238 RepID=A0A9Q6LSE7_PISSA|nr:tRNA pseudouridine(13) synthase TruD [Piscirickettsia salmonis]ALA24983.1 tRNA pseudouridine synthase, TruD family protein [Piscirickettsia salmonis]APS45278.1 tRNA pseudouridine synthase D [Piscirickettsia salmonis]APS48638.1 tRNA pseudouridine synthase D [Piscirickettsia salmonis]APS49887.1 tRNA pseudouridine synthase D [Piscirickettsia salmonis]APS53076.1 tRNA pseudouridine synthase D [Piscirickettsia salmonis]
MNIPLSFNWHYLNTAPHISCNYKGKPDDFQVDEVPLLDPEQFSGQGEHVFLHMEKKATNTEWLAKELARFADIPVRDVSFAGLKDRDALTTQWFSLRIPGKREFDWSLLNNDKIRVLAIGRHQKKLRRGQLAGNRFRLVLRHCQGDKALWQQRLELLKTQGIPNYFGPQRFGREGNNIQAALAMFEGKRVKRQQKSIYLSALRAYLFNQVLSVRLARGLANTVMLGDVMNLMGSNSIFSVDELNDDLQDELKNRLHERDIVLTGPLAGKAKQDKNNTTPAAVFDQEALAAAGLETWQQGLIQYGLDADRRALFVYLRDFNWHWLDDQTLELQFFLAKGSFATSVLRELANCERAELAVSEEAK